jgi:non-ribosomal peptide synthetase component E (peptide arylation enzyme)
MQVLAAEFAERARRAPGDVAVIDRTGRHTTAELQGAAQDLADRLGAMLTGAPTVLVQADNTWRTLAAALAVGERGGVVVVISRHATRSEYDLACEDVLPDAVVASDDVLSSWGASPQDFPARGAVLEGWSMISREGAARGVERWAGGVAVAMTSGSTGRPKCVVQSERAIRYAGRATIEAVGLQPGDPVGALVPLSSVAAFCFGMYLPAMLGGPQVCLDGWKPEAALDVMERHAVRWTMLVPTMALQLSIAPRAAGTLRSLTAMTVGGGPMNAGALERAETVLGTRFLRVFGMSECLGHTTSLPTDPPEVRLGTDGRPFPGTEFRVVDESGRPLPAGETGQAQVRGPSLFVGYARNGVAQPPVLTDDGFLPTGDRARVADDGSVTILGREKQIIIRGGRNIDINEVEAALAEIPSVTQVCVVPVADEMLGERAAALVVSPEKELTLQDVRTHLQKVGFPKFKWPEFVHVVPALPHNRVGKLSRPDAVALAERLVTSEGGQA